MPVLVDTCNSTTATNASSITLSSFTVANNANRVLYLCAGNTTGSGTGLAHSGWTWNTSETPTEIHDAQFETYWQTAIARLANPTATTASASVNIASTNEDLFLGALSVYNAAGTESAIVTSLHSGTTAWWGGVASGSGKLAVCFGFGKTGASLTTANGIPDYIAVGTASQSNSASGLTPTGAPAGRLVGDLEFCSIATENNETISGSGAGWTKIGSTVQQDSTWQQELWYRIYTGTNVDPAFTWSTNAGCSARRWIYRNTATSGTLFGFHTTNSGSTSTHSITGSNATGNDSCVMYLSHAEANTALGADADYTERFDAGSATGPYRLVVGDRDQATSGAGSANFSATGASASWVMRLLELFNANNGNQTDQTKVTDFGSNETGGVIATEAGDTYNTFGFTATLGTASAQSLLFSIDEAATSSSLLYHTSPVAHLIGR